MQKMKIKKNNKVVVISGKYRGKIGKVLISYPKNRKILVEGINVYKKHYKPRKQGEKGRIIETLKPFFASKVKLICSKCGKSTRIGHVIEDKKKFRICKKCNQKI